VNSRRGCFPLTSGGLAGRISVHGLPDRAIMSSEKKYCVGIDFGGTNTKFCLLDADFKPSEIMQLRTAGTPDEIVQQMICGCRKLIADHGLDSSDVIGVGIGSPGPLDLDKGTILATPNIPGMEGLPIRDLVGDGLKLPAVLENDANAAAYGEYICGAGAGAKSIVLLTLGTGVGSGIIIDGKLLHGSHGIGAELGHMCVEPEGELCGCGQRGCLERYCSATYIAERARKLIKEGTYSGVLAAVLKQSGAITAKDIVEAVAAGDAFACQVWDRGIYFLAMACVNICRIFDPDRIILAGGMTNAGARLLEPLIKHFTSLHWSITDIRTKIDIATLGKDAGAIGAAGVAWSAYGSP